jgi:hypothetical protein
LASAKSMQQVMSRSVQQADNTCAASTMHRHAPEAAVLHLRMRLFGQLAPPIHRLPRLAGHPLPPLLNRERLALALRACATRIMP